MTPEALAQLFHETYERLAPTHGYETREASAKPWADVPEPNRSLMIAVGGEVLDGLFGVDRGRAMPPADDRWWHVALDRLDHFVYDVVRFGFADENDGLAADEVAAKIQDWADHSSGPPKAVYAAAARALAEPPPTDPTTLDRPEREWRRVPKRPPNAHQTRTEKHTGVVCLPAPADAAEVDGRRLVTLCGHLWPETDEDVIATSTLNRAGVNCPRCLELSADWPAGRAP